ncbi:14815_t:CDS:2, partial [Cetraspora pellucida]
MDTPNDISESAHSMMRICDEASPSNPFVDLSLSLSASPFATSRYHTRLHPMERLIENYEDSENDDNYSLQFNLASITIGNYKSKKFETVTVSFNSENDAICFGLECGRLDIQFMGVESYERDDRKICLKLRNNIVKWILP